MYLVYVSTVISRRVKEEEVRVVKKWMLEWTDLDRAFEIKYKINWFLKKINMFVVL